MKRFGKKLLSGIIMAAMTISAFAITASASSNFYYGFTFNVPNKSQYTSGTKDDTAAAIIHTKALTSGKTIYYRLHSNASTSSYISSIMPVSVTGKRNLSYFSGEGYARNVYLFCSTPNTGTVKVSGVWAP